MAAVMVLIPVSISHGVQESRPAPPCARSTGQAAGLRYQMSEFGQCRRHESLPLLISLHGMGDHPREPFSELPVPVRVVMPRAPLEWGTGYSWFPFRSGEVSGARLAPEIRKAANRVAGLIGELRKRFPTRGKAVVMGVSQGGMISYALAVSHQDQVRAAFPVAGWLPKQLWPGRRAAHAAPTFAMHGKRDAVVPFAPTAAMAERMAKLGHPVTLEPFAHAGHDVSPEMHARLYVQVMRALRNL